MKKNWVLISEHTCLWYGWDSPFLMLPLFLKKKLKRNALLCLPKSGWLLKVHFFSHLFSITLTFSLLSIELSPSCALQFRAETPQNREELYCGALEMHFHCMVFTNSQSQIPNDSNSIIDLTKIVLRLLGVTLPHVCRTLALPFQNQWASQGQWVVY